jgi:hypothetical protein
VSDPIVDQDTFNRTVVSALRDLYLATLPTVGAIAERARADHERRFLDALGLLNAYATHGTMPPPSHPTQEP